MSIRYIKLPSHLDVDKLIVERALELYRVCPYCGERERIGEDVASAGWLQRYEDGLETNDYDCRRLTLDGKMLSLRKHYKWVRINFRCGNCGLNWQSERYPTGLSSDKNIIKKLMSMPLTGDNSAMIVVRRDIERLFKQQPMLEMRGGLEDG